MAKCKDCIHYNVCGFTSITSKTMEKDCKQFKNKVDFSETKHGSWISASQKQGVNIGMKCSFCGARIKYSEFLNGNHNFCHRCGAKMNTRTPQKEG